MLIFRSGLKSRSYTAPVVTALTAPTTLATAGGEFVTLTGTNFGPDSVSDFSFETTTSRGCGSSFIRCFGV